MLRKVCVEAPRRPTVAAGCGGRFDPDLEAILLKALRKEPQERYLTAEQLASDLRAHIEGRPVAARRGTVRYRAAKFIRRHRFGLLGALCWLRLCLPVLRAYCGSPGLQTWSGARPRRVPRICAS